ELVENSAGALGAHRVAYIFVSTQSQGIHRRVLELLAGPGYRLEAEGDFAQTTSYDGFIFAASPGAKPVFRNFEPYGRTSIAPASSQQLVERLAAIRASIVNR